MVCAKCRDSAIRPNWLFRGLLAASWMRDLGHVGESLQISPSPFAGETMLSVNAQDEH